MTWSNLVVLAVNDTLHWAMIVRFSKALEIWSLELCKVEKSRVKPSVWALMAAIAVQQLSSRCFVVWRGTLQCPREMKSALETVGRGAVQRLTRLVTTMYSSYAVSEKDDSPFTRLYLYYSDFDQYFLWFVMARCLAVDCTYCMCVCFVVLVCHEKRNIFLCLHQQWAVKHCFKVISLAIHLLFINPSTVHLAGSVDRYFAWHNISFCNKSIWVKLGTNILHVIGRCWKVFHGHWSKIKFIAKSNHISTVLKLTFRKCGWFWKE